MPTTVHLQPNFATGFIPLFLLFLFIVWPVISRMFDKNKRKSKKRNNIEKDNIKPVPLPIKNSYIYKIENIASLYERKEITSKQGFQNLSVLVRNFVLEYAGIDVTKKTLAEIRALDIEKVEKIVEACYEPEFSSSGSGDFYKAIYEAKKIIDTWN